MPKQPKRPTRKRRKKASSPRAKKEANSRSKITARKCLGTPDLDAVARLRRQFESDARRWKEGNRQKDDRIAAFGYWIGYPFFLEMNDLGQAADDADLGGFDACGLGAAGEAGALALDLLGQHLSWPKSNQSGPVRQASTRLAGTCSDEARPADSSVQCPPISERRLTSDMMR